MNIIFVSGLFVGINVWVLFALLTGQVKLGRFNLTSNKFLKWVLIFAYVNIIGWNIYLYGF